MRYRVDGETVLKDAGLGEFRAATPSFGAVPQPCPPGYGQIAVDCPDGIESCRRFGCVPCEPNATPNQNRDGTWGCLEKMPMVRLDGALGQPQGVQCTDNPRWQPSAFDKKALWCMCGAGPTLRRCPGCCGPCPSCQQRRCQQPHYKVFQSNDVDAFDCKCGPCGGGGAS